MKSFIAAAAAAPFLALPAIAGPYVNVETIAGFKGSDLGAATTDLHVGYEGDLSDTASYYVQGGPALISVDGEDMETELAGKAGLGLDVAEDLNVYGEISFLTDCDEDVNYGVKAGFKYSF